MKRGIGGKESVSKKGSAQEFDKTRILGCFLKNEEFGLGDRHALSLEQQVTEILVAAAPSKKGFDVAVDGFHHSEAYFGAAGVEDAVQVIQQHVSEFLKGYRRAADGTKKIQREHEYSEWLACIPNAHPGYISWEQHQQNLKLLATNGRGYELARVSPPREGVALLQGRAVCGRCGRHLRVRYVSRRGKREAWYVCDRANATLGWPNCQSIAGQAVDEAIGVLVAERMTPAAVELALEIRREIEARHEEADQLRCRAIERAQIEADLAQRRFMLVDPSNRLV